MGRFFSEGKVQTSEPFTEAQNQEIAQMLKATDTSKLKNPLARTSIPQIIQTIEGRRSKVRNIAIIAHVDHGKTTLVDNLLKSAGEGIDMERTMDSGELEQEKGITIVAKVTSVMYKDHTINIVDTPGHQDFGGEVERVLSMVDGVVLVVCATEGTMRQTRFVLQKAVEHGLKPLVIINKVDRDSARVDEVENSIFDLFCSLNVPEDFLEYTTLYGSAKKGFVVADKNELKNQDKHHSMSLILDKIIDMFPAPKVEDVNTSFHEFNMLASQLERDNIHGHLVRGKILSGFAEIGSTLKIYNQNLNMIQSSQISKIFVNIGVKRLEVDRATAGDIVTIAGFDKARVTHILTSSQNPKKLPCPVIDPPMISVEIIPNSSPFAGNNGAKKMSLFDLRSRLEEEAERDLALKVEATNTRIKVLGRGDLHIGVILEKMRREGYEFQTTSPSIVFKEEDNEIFEPFEQITFEIKFNYISALLEKLMARNAAVKDSTNLPNDYQQIVAEISSRAALGLQTEIMSETSNDAKYESHHLGYRPLDRSYKRPRKNMLISCGEGRVTSYAMRDLERFGTFYIKPGHHVYKGQVIGISKDLEMEINPCKEKALKNVRTTEAEEKIFLSPPKTFTIEEAITFIGDDEYLEITPIQLRIRKIELDSGIRKRNTKQGL